MAFGSIRTVLVIFATVSGVAMVTADDDTLALETMNETMPVLGNALEDLINNLIMDGFAGQIGNLRYNVSNIMVSNLTIGDTNTTFDGNTAIIIMTLPMFDLTADWELGVNFTLFGRTFEVTREGDLGVAASGFEVSLVYDFPSFELQSCDADVDISVSLTGRGIILRLASILLGSNAVTSTLSTGIEEGICAALSNVTPETPE